MSTLANINDPEKMAHDGSFHEGLHYLLRQEKYKKFNMK